MSTQTLKCRVWNITVLKHQLSCLEYNGVQLHTRVQKEGEKIDINHFCKRSSSDDTKSLNHRLYFGLM